MDKSIEEKDHRSKMNSPSEMAHEAGESREHGSRIIIGPYLSASSRSKTDQSAGKRKSLLSSLLLASPQGFSCPQIFYIYLLRMLVVYSERKI